MNPGTTLHRAPVGEAQAKRPSGHRSHLLLLSVLALGACHTGTYRVVSPEKSVRLITEIQRPGKPPAVLPVRWVQPDNQPQPCKLFSEQWQHAPQRILWDGACKDGYAYGLGREFIVRSALSGSSAWIVRYHGGETPPTYYAWSKFAQQEFAFGDADKGLMLILKIETQPGGYQQLLTQRDGLSGAVRSRMVGTGVTETSHYYSDKSAVVLQTRSNPASSVASYSYVIKDDDVYGYGILKPRDRSLPLQTTSPAGIERLQLPRDYVDFLTRAISESNQQLVVFETSAEEGFLTMLQYRAAFCISPPAAFEEPSHYRDICAPSGDLTSVLPALAELERARSAAELSSAQAITNPSVRAEQVQLATIAQLRSYPTLSATVNRLLAEMANVPAQTYSMQPYSSSDRTPAQAADQPYCYDPVTFSPCVRTPDAVP